MSFNIDEYFEKVLADLENINHINPKDLPNIDLYMDQVTTFMDAKLTTTKRHADDKIMTKTMINNYSKNDLLPPPVKKKYSKEHMLELIFIYYFKNMLSIGDIQTLLKPISDKYFQSKDGLNLDDIYKEIYKNSKRDLVDIEEDLRSHFEKSKESFTDETGDDKQFLQLYTFVCSLAFEVYIKKHIMEQIIDGFFENYEGPNEAEVDESKKAKKKTTKSKE